MFLDSLRCRSTGLSNVHLPAVAASYRIHYSRYLLLLLLIFHSLHDRHLILLQRIAVRIPSWPSTRRIASLVPWMYECWSSPFPRLLTSRSLTHCPSLGSLLLLLFYRFSTFPDNHLVQIIVQFSLFFDYPWLSLPLLLPGDIRNSLEKRPCHWTFGIVRVVGRNL